jgi:hypothetical protein
VWLLIAQGFCNACFVVRKVPYIGQKVQEPFREWLTKQKKKLHHKPGSTGSGPAVSSDGTRFISHVK